MRPAARRDLRRLRRDGPATSTSLARVLGENTGNTSYHLRQLAEHGFVRELPDRGSGRERWWDARHQDIRFPQRSRMNEETGAAFEELQQLNVAEDVEAFARFQNQRDQLGEWGDALVFSRGALRLTGAEFQRFWDDYMAFYRRWAGATEPPAEDSRRVLVRFVAFPGVDEA